MTDVNGNTSAPEVEEVLIDQDHEQGPGWFLLTSYAVIAAFCLYYLFTFWDWRSDYEEQQDQQRTGIEQTVP